MVLAFGPETKANTSCFERDFSIPMTEIIGLQFHDVSPDGSNLTLTFESRVGEPVVLSMPTDNLEGLLRALRDAKIKADAVHKPSNTILSFRNLMTWFVAALPYHDHVLLVLDGDTPLETSYAMLPKVAEDLAAAMIETSEIVRSQVSRKDN